MAVCLLLMLLLSGPALSLYCDSANCYDGLDQGRYFSSMTVPAVLGVTASASTKEIRASYHRLSKLYHPDKNSDKDTVAKFQLVAAAYETLSDDESRQNYDHMLAHPEQYYNNMYRFYRHKATPKVGVLPTLLAVITAISALQYFAAWAQYERVRKFAFQNQWFREEAEAIAEREGRFGDSDEPAAREAVIRAIILENVVVHGSKAPSIWNVLWLQLLLSPIWFPKFVKETVAWHVHYSYYQRPVRDQDKDFFICRELQIPMAKLKLAPQEQLEELYAFQAWTKAGADAWKLSKMKARNPGKFKKYERAVARGAVRQ